VHALLRHLEDVGFGAAPPLVGSGLDADGREVLTFIDGEFTQPGPWSLDAAAAAGRLLRDLHRATRSFRPPPDAVWFPWPGRDLGRPVKVIGHCDVAPWNIVARDGLPVALIDWETAGPVDPLVELAQLAWLNAKLHDDIVARREHLPPLAGPGPPAGRHRRRLRADRSPAARLPGSDHRVRHLRHRLGSRRRGHHPGDDRASGRAMGDGLARPLGGLDDPAPSHPRDGPRHGSIVNNPGPGRPDSQTRYPDDRVRPA
jgi:hypothetical protein